MVYFYSYIFSYVIHINCFYVLLIIMDPTIWGPPYWFFLHNVAFNYPKYPTTIQKKIHYRLIHNLHEYLPSKSIATVFVKIVNQTIMNFFLNTGGMYWIIKSYIM